MADARLTLARAGATGWTAWGLLNYLTQGADDRERPGHVGLSLSEVARETGLDRVTVRRALRLLEEVGMVKRLPRPGDGFLILTFDVLTGFVPEGSSGENLTTPPSTGLPQMAGEKAPTGEQGGEWGGEQGGEILTTVLPSDQRERTPKTSRPQDLKTEVSSSLRSEDTSRRATSRTPQWGAGLGEVDGANRSIESPASTPVEELRSEEEPRSDPFEEWRKYLGQPKPEP